MVDINKLKAFADKVEWEGGVPEVIGYGLLDSGVPEFNILIRKFAAVMEELDSAWSDLYESYDLGGNAWEDIEPEDYDDIDGEGDDIDYDDLNPYEDEPH